MDSYPPIIIVSGDEDDEEIMKEVWKELKLKYPLVYLNTGEELIQYLRSLATSLPFLIICDIQLLGMNGFQLKERIMHEDQSTYVKSIPFIFMSGLAQESDIEKAYSVCGHGFFIKNVSFDDLVQEINSIVSYWSKSKVPIK